jgi:uncharacterized protein (DUF697 family)
MAFHAQDGSDLPGSPDDLAERVARSKRLVKRRAMVAAGVAVLPIPGLDWMTDAGVLLRVIPEINRIFGLAPQQIEPLSFERRVRVHQAILLVGSAMIGKLVTQQMVWHLLRAMGLRLGAQQVAKFVPLIGQGTSAALTFFALRHVCEQHIAQCVQVSQAASKD